MPIADILFLALVLTAFAAFSGTLAWVSRRERPAAARQQRQPSPLTQRHA